MSDHATEAARNISIKERHLDIENPIKAIGFAISLDSDECQSFLLAWQCGAWAEIEDCYPRFFR